MNAEDRDNETYKECARRYKEFCEVYGPRRTAGLARATLRATAEALEGLMGPVEAAEDVYRAADAIVDRNATVTPGTERDQ